MVRRTRGLWLTGTLWLGVGIVCVLPAAWTLLGVATRPAAWENVADGYHLQIHLKTLGFSLIATLIACGLAIGPAVILRGGRGLGFTLVAMLALATLAVPEAAWAYGGAEAWRQWLGSPRMDSWLDWLRAILTTSGQIWPIPTAAMAIAWARLPAGVLDAATLDGARGRITRQLLLPALLAGGGGALLLAGRQVSAYDQTGIVVTGVLVRDAYVLAEGGSIDRTAAAAAAGAPLYAMLAAIAVASVLLLQKSLSNEPAEFAARPRRSRSWRRRFWIGLSLVPVVATTILGLIALIRTAGGVGVLNAYAAYAPQLHTGLLHAGLAAGVCFILAGLVTIARGRGIVGVAAFAFLVGGQLISLGLLRLVNTPPSQVQPLRGLQDALYTAAYQSPLLYVWAPAALFAWIALAAARATWGGQLLAYRRQASVDGANRWQTARHVVWPLAWPGLLAATVAVLALSLGETAAAVLLYPDTLVNVMMTNVHTLAYPAMAQSALLGAFACAAVAAMAICMWRFGQPIVQFTTWIAAVVRRIAANFYRWLLPTAATILVFTAPGCDAPEPPKAVWSSVGTGDGQLVYPRGIVYSEADDAIWVVDRTARVQKLDAATGEFLLGWQMPDWKYGKPVGLGIDDEGNVWVPDTHYGRVVVYGPNGGELFRFGENGTGPGQFVWPTDVLVLDDSRVLVSEYGAGETGSNDRIQLFERGPDNTMTPVMSIGSFGIGEGQFRRPQSMAKIGDELWVADAANHRLLAFSLRDEDFGTYLRVLGDGGPGDAPGQFRFPYGLAVDDDGNLLVAEFGNNRLQKIDPKTGESLGLWGRFGPRPGELRYPWALAYDSKRDHVVVVDSGNDRLQVMNF